MKIMIVDDHQGIRKKIRELLAKPDVDAREYTTGEEAIPAARTIQPDWIIMDVYLPGKNGLEVTKTIHKEVPSARIILISTNDQNYLREAALEAGAEKFLSKLQLADLPGLLNGSPRDAR